MAYFECNLPREAPAYIHPSHTTSLTNLLNTVHERMEKLEAACEACGYDGITPATFAEYAKVLFNSNLARFEVMTSDDLAVYACMVHTPGYKADERMEWPNATVLADTAFLTREEWEAVRRLGIGGSDAAVVQGISPYNTPFGLYHNKCWTAKAVTAYNTKQGIFDRGHYMEDKVIEAFCSLTGAERIPETRMFQSKKYPAATANPDAIVRMPDGGIYVFEAKTTLTQNSDAWAEGRTPPHYEPQTRQYPAVLNDKRVKGTFIGCLFTVDMSIHGIYAGSNYDDGSFVYRLVERNKTKENATLRADQDFYDLHLAEKTEPPFTGDPSVNKQVLADLIGPANPALPPIALDASFMEPIRDFLDIQESRLTIEHEADALKTTQDGLACQLIAALGEAVEGRLAVPGSPLGEYYEVKYAPRKSTKVDYELLKARFPDAYEACVTVDPCGSRTFTLKVKGVKRTKR